MTKKVKSVNFSKAKKDFEKEAKSLDWDDLAFRIITVEYMIIAEKDDNYLKLLELKLEILEDEKKNRVFETFDMQDFLNKEYHHVEDYF